MKKLTLFVVALCTTVLTFAVSPVYTLDTKNDTTAVETYDANTGNGSYQTANDITVNGITWNAMCNITMAPWRVGGKSLTTGTDREIYTKTAYENKLDSVVVTLGTSNLTSLNSLSFVYGTDSTFTGSDTIKVTSPAASSAILFAPAAGIAANSYVKFIFNVTVSGTSNKYVQFSRVDFYGEGEQIVDTTSTVHIENTFETAYTTTEIVNILNDKKSILTDTVFVKGVVDSIYQISTNYGNATYFINDGTTQFEVYQGYGLNKELMNTEDYFAVNDTVVVKGLVTVYNKTPEFVGKANYMVYLGKYVASTSAIETDATSIAFGSVEQNATVDAQTLTVTGVNLTEVITYNTLTKFDITGTLTADGGNLTIAPKTTTLATVGTYSETLTLTSGEITTDVTISITVTEENHDGLKTVNVNSNSIYAANGVLHVNATAGSIIEVYNVLGQRMISTTAQNGDTTINGLRAGQIVIVKANNKVVKVNL